MDGQNFTAANVSSAATMSPSERACMVTAAALLVVVIVGGLFGNCLVCVVILRNKKMRTASNIQLVTLAVADMMVCLFSASIRLYSSVKILIFDKEAVEDFSKVFNIHLCKVQVFFMFSSVFISMITMATLSVTRALGIRGHISLESVKKTVVFCISVSYTVGIMYGAVKAVFAPDLTCFMEESPSDSAVKSTYVGAAIFITCLALLLASYLSIYRTIQRHRQEVLPWLHGANHLNKMDIATIRVSITLVLSFLVTYLPGTLYFLAMTLNDHVPVKPLQFNLTISIMYMGSLMNPFIYALMSTSFKKHLFKKKSKTLPQAAVTAAVSSSGTNLVVGRSSHRFPATSNFQSEITLVDFLPEVNI